MSGSDSRPHDMSNDQFHSNYTYASDSYEMRPRSKGIHSWGNLVTSVGYLMRQRWRRKLMVYVARDAQGRLLRVEQKPFEGAEHIAVESEELQNWLTMKEEVKERLESLHSSDLELVRVLEDVIIILVDRGVIQYTDLPLAARTKLDERALARADLEGLNTMLRDASE
jgi:hypothetical protein